MTFAGRQLSSLRVRSELPPAPVASVSAHSGQTGTAQNAVADILYKPSSGAVGAERLLDEVLLVANTAAAAEVVAAGLLMLAAAKAASGFESGSAERAATEQRWNRDDTALQVPGGLGTPQKLPLDQPLGQEEQMGLAAAGLAAGCQSNMKREDQLKGLLGEDG